LITNLAATLPFGLAYVINSGSGSGTLRLRRKIPLLFVMESLKQLVGTCLFKQALLNGRAAFV
jgi:hypothetical protein